MDIFNKITLTIDSSYLEPSFIQQIETHLPLLMLPNNYSTVTIEPYLTKKFRGDFYGLLIEKNINPIAHYASLRINGFKNPSDYQGDINTFLVSSTELIVNIMNLTQVEYT